MEANTDTYRSRFGLEAPRGIEKCDCLVGFLSGERVRKSDIDYEVKRISDIQPKFKEYGLLNGDPLSTRQIVDNRRGYLSRFSYCPYCGEKINWKQVLSNCYNNAHTQQLK